MEKEFCNYDQSVKLNELGFNEPCLATINNYGWLHIKGTRRGAGGAVCTIDVPSPLKQQVFDWFRIEHQIFASIETDCTSYPKFAIVINGFVGNPKDLTEKEWYWEKLFYSDLYRSYPEAESDCIDKLIELIEKKKV